MKLQAGKLSAHLKNSLAPCYLVSGDEHLLVNEALDAIREAARARGFASRELHVATTGFDWSQLQAAGANLSLFAEQRIIEVRLPTGKPGKAGGQALVDFVAQLGPELMLIVSTPKLDRSSSNSKWAKTLEAAGVSLPIWPVGVRELPGWIAERMRAVDLQPESSAVAIIVDRVEGNLLAANQEIEKLRLLLGAGKVTADDVNAAVANSSRYDVYQLVDAAMAADAARALKILHGLQAEGTAAALVGWAIARELRTLTQVAEQVAQGESLAAAMQAARIWNSRQGLVRSCVSRLHVGRLRQLQKAAAAADEAVRGQQPGSPWQHFAAILAALGERRRAA